MNMKIKTRRLLTVAACMLFLAFVATTASAGTIQLPKGTKVKLKFPPNMKINSGNVSAGIPLVCYLAEPLEVGGIVVVDANAEGTAMVSEVQSAKSGGKPGRIKIEFASLQPKGEYRPLTADVIKLSGSQEAKGKGKGIFPYLFFVFFLKGSQAVIPTNAVYTAEVAETIVLENK
jgi:hypothetical protein